VPGSGFSARMKTAFCYVWIWLTEYALVPLKPSAFGFITAAELGHQRRRVVRISTGSKQLDAILGG
jgi:meiotic recombination protein DMC1